MKVGINGFGRMGRLALRAAWDCEELEFVAVNEPMASAENMAHLFEFDSTQGRWREPCHGAADSLSLGTRSLHYLQHQSPGEIPWGALGVDLVLECSGKFRDYASLQGHLKSGAKRVLVSRPIDSDLPNVVLGVNHDAFDLGSEPILSAASCSTNCLAPIVRVLHDAIGIERGLVTTIHNPTNTQSVQDAAHKDPRRARAAMLSLIPTSTNSASAVTLIVPELKGKLDSIAVRAPVLNASLLDCVFQVQRDVSVAQVNEVLEQASKGERLKGIMGFETRPLVSVDYAGDARSSIIDAQSTRVTDHRLVKILAWYDNEWGYANRLVELAAMLVPGCQAAHA